MTSRTRELILADESRRQFESLLGSWVYHRLDYQGSDYGIDGQVEIFEAGATTGLKCEVQLKGTDKSDLDSALKVRLRAQHAIYYSSLDLPVLLVVYVHAHKQVYYSWWHSHSVSLSSMSQTVTINIPQQNIWGTTSLSEISRVARQRRMLGAGPPAKPVRLRKSVDATHPSQAVTSIKMRQGLEHLRDLVHLQSSEGADDGTIVVEKGRLIIEYGAYRVADFAIAETELGLASSLSAASALYFNVLGDVDTAITVLQRSLEKNILQVDQDNIGPIAGLLLRGRAVELSMRLASHCRRGSDDIGMDLSRTIHLIPSMMTSLSDHEFGLVQADLEKAWLEDKGDFRAEIAYNRGSQYRSRRRFEEALPFYELALACDSSYAARDYFHAEVAGMHFQLGNYSKAAKAYNLAILAGGDTPRTRALYADALMFSGAYVDAGVAFDEWWLATTALGRPLVTPDNAEWLLKRWLLAFFKDVGLTMQVRDMQTAFEIIVCYWA